jgi:hypothetical protein
MSINEENNYQSMSRRCFNGECCKVITFKEIFIHIAQISAAYASTQLERSLIFPRLIGACEQIVSYLYFYPSCTMVWF